MYFEVTFGLFSCNGYFKANQDVSSEGSLPAESFVLVDFREVARVMEELPGSEGSGSWVFKKGADVCKPKNCRESGVAIF